MQDLDPANPWVKDPSGRHTNVSALLDWPEESDESDEEVSAPSGIVSLTHHPSPRPDTTAANPSASPGTESSTRLGQSILLLILSILLRTYYSDCCLWLH